jgi:hypothetical protein
LKPDPSVSYFLPGRINNLLIEISADFLEEVAV